MRKVLLVVFILNYVFASTQVKKNARFSLTAEYGYSYFDGDINQHLHNLIPTSLRNITYGFTLDYNLSPAWQIGLDAIHLPLRANNTSPVPLSIHTDLNSLSLMGTVNFTKLFFPRGNHRLTFSTSVGLGYAFYTYDVRHLVGGLPDEPVKPTDTYPDIKLSGQVRPILLKDDNGTMINGVAITNPVVFIIDYNISKPLSIGAKVHYRSYAKDNLEGVTYLNFNGVTNDYVGVGTVFLRYKFNNSKRNHLMNINMNQWEPEESLPLVAALRKEVDALKGRVDQVEKKVDAIVPRIEKIEAMLSNEGPDTDNDGVIDLRDLHPNTPVNTPVDFFGKPIPLIALKADVPVNQKSTFDIDDIPSVYFDFDRIHLDDQALITIRKIAKRMMQEASLLVEVRGYTDFLGDVQYNERLSTRRAERVKQEMVKVWGIDPDRIIANGKGKVLQPQIKYRPNRRCDFFFANDIVDVLNN